MNRATFCSGIGLTLLVAACGSDSPPGLDSSGTGGLGDNGGSSSSSGAPGTGGSGGVMGGTGGGGGVAGGGGTAGNAGAGGAGNGGTGVVPPLGPVVFQPNVRVNDDATSGNQTEVALATGPNGLAIAGWMDFRGARTCAYSVSTDGGVTWGENVFIGVATGEFVGDPAVAIDADGRLYAGCQEYNTEGSNGEIRLITSSNGSTWSSPQSIQSAPDKPWLGASPAQGGVAFLTWLGGNAGVKRTTDGGMTWEPAHDLEFLNHGTTISVGTSGLVHLAYSPNGGAVRYVRSTDLGDSWEEARTIGETGTFCWSDCEGPRQHPIMGGGSDSTGQYVAVTWSAELEGGQGDEDVWVIYSSDGGDTWTEPVLVNDNVNPSRQLQPWVVVDDYGRVHVAWTDLRNGENETWYARSADPSVGFETNVQVTDTSGPQLGGFMGDYKGISISGQDVLVVWQDTREGDGDIFSARAIGAAAPGEVLP